MRLEVLGFRVWLFFRRGCEADGGGKQEGREGSEWESWGPPLNPREHLRHSVQLGNTGLS